MKTNNRPMVKEQSIGQVFNGNKYNKITTEVERPMNEAEYIEYLEKENQELKGKIALQQSSYEKEFRELNDKLLKVIEETILNTWFERMITNFITEKVALRRQDVNYLMNEIRKELDK